MTSSYEQSVRWLYSRVNFERLGGAQYGPDDFKLERMARLLEAMGNPQLQIPAVHIAGTKGKGTTASLVASMLQESGYRVGLFTSPHREKIEERFVVNRTQATPEQFVNLVDMVQDYCEKLDQSEPGAVPTFFEAVTAIGWLYFLKEEVDIAVVEVGMGGRLDSTNLCSPIVTAITSISLDHTRILGADVETITREKAGIIKPNIPVFTSVTQESCVEVINEVAYQNESVAYQLGKDFEVNTVEPWNEFQRSQKVCITVQKETDLSKQHELTIPKPGKIYAENLALAVAISTELERQGWDITQGAIERASETMDLPLRFEILQEQPLLIADAAHNPASIQALISILKDAFPDRELIWILAISKEKDAAGICREIRGNGRVIATQYLGNNRTLPTETIVETLQAEEVKILGSPETPEKALKLAKEFATSDDVIVATGSLFLAAEIRELVMPSKTGELPISG